MECIECKIVKLSQEFRSQPLTKRCNHIPYQCATCLYKYIQQNKQCPTCKATVKTINWEPNSYPIATTQLKLGDSENLTVNLLEGDTLTIPYNPQMTVQELKLELQKRTKVPPNKQLLIANEKTLQLCDQKFRPLTLHEQDIPGGSVIQLVILKYTMYAGNTTIDGAPKDIFDNAQGSEYDLVEDGTFKGLTVVVVQIYQFPFENAKEALEEKGFTVIHYTQLPPLDEFQKSLDKACQLWVISSSENALTPPFVDAIRFFFEEGHGLYIWGDNAPFFADANVITQELFGISMSGDLPGGQVVHAQKSPDPTNMNEHGLPPGFFPHLITTGMEHLYEGITIATINVGKADNLQPLVRGSAGNLLTVVYDYEGKRCVIDGGFTRMYCNWNTAGTGRYIKNSAAWLVNYERFFSEYGNL